MTGKRIVLLVIAFSIICLIIAWFWLQNVITDYDLDRAMETPKFTISEKADEIYPSSLKYHTTL